MQRVSRRERRLLLLALGAIALHVVTDAFVAPEPGTGWDDHLVPAAVPLGILALAAAVTLRACAGLVAATALVLGAWSLVGAGLALADVSRGRLRADGPTGLLLGAAGLVLIGLGVRVLWQTRRRDGGWLLRRLGLSLLAVLVLAWVVVPVSIAIVATHRPRGAVGTIALGRPAREVTLPTSDGLALRASYVPSRNGAAVILFPERAGTAAHGRMLARRGYGVLALDMRGYGASEGDPNALGWGAAPDIAAAVAYLASRSDVTQERIAGLGLSVGGEVLLEAAAANPGLRAVVSDGAGERSVRESITRGAAAALVLPLQALQTVAVAALGGDRPPEGLQDLVGRIAPRPVLLILAGRGGGGEELNRTYAARAGAGTELWEIPEATHTGGIRARPAEYERRVIAFLDRALGVEPK
jgi:pimeloyl-ACP methyl ester carboxylesterase